MELIPRGWQVAALDLAVNAFQQNEPAVLLDVCPSAGKTYFTAMLFARLKAEGLVNRLCVVSPSVTVAHSWHKTLRRFKLDMPHVTGSANVLKALATSDGVSCTYSTFSGGDMNALPSDVLLVADESHHTAEKESAWGGSLLVHGNTAAHKLLLSGTPWTTTGHAMPWQNEATPKFSYSFRDAVEAGDVAKPAVVFFRDDVTIIPEGSTDPQKLPCDWKYKREATRSAVRQAMLSGSAMKSAVETAVTVLQEMRATTCNVAKGLVVCADDDAAKEMTTFLRSTLGRDDAVVLSTCKSDGKSEGLTDFKNRPSALWLVAVKKAAEGFDCPEIKVGVYASNILSSRLFWMQTLSRATRRLEKTDGSGEIQDAIWFVPALPELLAHKDALEVTASETGRILGDHAATIFSRLSLGTPPEQEFEALQKMASRYVTSSLPAFEASGGTVTGKIKNPRVASHISEDESAGFTLVTDDGEQDIALPGPTPIYTLDGEDVGRLIEHRFYEPYQGKGAMPKVDVSFDGSGNAFILAAGTKSHYLKAAANLYSKTMRYHTKSPAEFLKLAAEYRGKYGKQQQLNF